MTNNSKWTTHSMLQAVEQYLAQAETYEYLTLQRIADYLKVGVHIVYRWLPADQWEQLRSEWIQNRLREVLDLIRAQARSQEDFSVKRIASYAKMPPTIVHCYLPKDDLKKALHVTLPGSQGKPLSQERVSTIERYIYQAEMYLAQNESYKTATVRHFAKFLGEPEHIVYDRLPRDQWEMLRNSWLQNHLKQAMDTAYAEARSQDDFTLKNIAKHAGMSYMALCRLLSEDELQARRTKLPTFQKMSEMTFLKQAEVYLAQTEDYKALTVTHFAEFLGIPSQTASSHLSNQPWEKLRKEWIRNRLKQAMDAVSAEATTQDEITMEAIARQAGIPISIVYRYLSKNDWRARQETRPPKDASRLQQLRQALERVYAEAKTQEDFTMSKIIELADVPQKVANRLIGDEWRTRKGTLPTIKEKVLATLQKLVDDGIPVNELTRRRIVEIAEVHGEGTWHWFDQPYRTARHRLALRSREQIIEPQPGTNIRLIPGGWIDLDDDIWDLRPAGKRLLRKDQLRKDIQDIVWSILRKELHSSEITLSTICLHYEGFRQVATALDNEVSDVRRARLEAVQRAWMNIKGTKTRQGLVRTSLAQIFDALAGLAEQDNTIDNREMFRISAWLRNDISIGRTELGEEFLSESELNGVIQGCLVDIMAGITFTNTYPDLFDVCWHPRSQKNAIVVVHWAVALMLLVMAFTGLRRESVLSLKTDDWAEVHPDLYVLAWCHNKKIEEHVAVLPAAIAQELQLYVQRTAQVRSALKTEAVFLGNNHQGHWQLLPIAQFHHRLHEFAQRHHLEREGRLLTLNSTILRRTYVTRALYEGRNLAALRSQMGHIHFDSTLRYAKFDRYEHPAEVGAPLDEYGRKALILWRTPIILDELDPDERASLLGTKVERQQDVGLCRYAQCVMATQGSPPPCSLCGHLVTGPEFLEAWRTERLWRKQELERLAQEPEFGVVFAQMKSQFERFEANFTFIQERFHT